MTCSHEGYHSGRGRYDRPTGTLRYVIVCDDCQAEVAQILTEPYAPAFVPRDQAGVPGPRREPGRGDRRGLAPRHTLRMPDPAALLTALRAGPATLDALAARLGGPARDTLTWALEDARERGWVVSPDDEDCGPDGICSTGAPLVFRLTEAGRARVGELRRAGNAGR